GEKFTDPQKEVFIVDTIGELKRFYTLSSIAYVGKSMFSPGGGQNMLEPVALGRPTLYGPHTRNFRGIADVLAQRGGSEIAQDAWQLKEKVCEILSDH
ncbi:3-deoxy-D-manno-octulosonic acid transferase, partial [bacterium]|nr:3-deoxy-D-manno-octulosonic acid transferase [bacterium]